VFYWNQETPVLAIFGKCTNHLSFHFLPCDLSNQSQPTHTTCFHQQLPVIYHRAVAGLATCMLNKDQIIASLMIIPKDYKNSELVIARDIIEGDSSQFPTLVGISSPCAVYQDAGSPVHLLPNAQPTHFFPKKWVRKVVFGHYYLKYLQVNVYFLNNCYITIHGNVHISTHSLNLDPSTPMT
jgi:hypothetical protein